MLIPSIKQQQGLTLVEILVALAISLLLLLSISTFFLDSLRNMQYRQNAASLNSQLRTITQLVEQDARRAGYSPTFGDTSVSGIHVVESNQCFLYDYYNTASTTTSSVRQTGFKVGSQGDLLVYNPPLVARPYTRPSTTTRDSICGSCDSSVGTGTACENWYPISDRTKYIFDFTAFNFNAPAGNIDQRFINLTLRLRLRADQNVSRTSTITITNSNGG